MASEVSVCHFRHYDAGFPIQDEFLHWTMESHPTLLYCVGEGLFPLIGDQHSRMPPGASVQQVEDSVVVNEEEIALDLLVEVVGDVDAAHVVRAWLSPHPADLARVADLRDQVQNFIWDSDSFQESAHDLGRGMPPSHMELAQGEPMCSDSSSPE